MLDGALPDDPFIFTMGHELKHFLKDKDLGITYCDSSKATEYIEIGAEIFSAELIYPERDFAEDLKQIGIGKNECNAEALVRLKHETRTTLSYAGLAKRAEFMGYAPKGSLPNSGWKKLEEEIYGVPFFKRRSRR
ncbi:MAG: ImmA/IrrE family metallo-endopeptidase [Acidobacteria bacterium]|nr:ImmA/IrrE family metallo-endopeptidase [Acidobacteriota bacterium]